MSIQERWFGNLKLKALALILALLLWLLATTGAEGDLEIMIPVRLQNLSPRFSVGNHMPSVIEFRIVGPKMLLWRLKGEHPVLALDLKGVGEGSVKYVNLENYVHLQRGIRITRVYPATIELEIMKTESQPAARAE
jgi:hypothetical protein